MKCFLYLLSPIVISASCLASDDSFPLAEPQSPRSNSEFMTQPSDDSVPPLESLINLEDPCGFNLLAVEKRQKLLRQDPMVRINDEPATHVMNLARSTQLNPELTRIPFEIKKDIERIFNQKKDFGSEGRKKLERELKKIGENNSIELSEFNVAHVVSIVATIERILSDFSSFGITLDHLKKIPSRDKWNEERPKLRPHARIRKLSLSQAKEISQSPEGKETLLSYIQSPRSPRTLASSRETIEELKEES